MKYITLFNPQDNEVVQSVQLTPPVGKTFMNDQDWKAVADTIKVQSGLSYAWGKAEANDVIRNGEIVPRPTVEKTFEELQAQASAQIDVEYGKAIQLISAGYPLEERESWPVQTAEARALLADINAFTPWIDAASNERGLSRTDLAQRIAGLDGAYRTIHGKISGMKQLLQERIWKATTPEELIPLQWQNPLM